MGDAAAPKGKTVVDPNLLDILQVDCGNARPPPLKATVKNDFLRNIMFEGQGASSSAKMIEAFRPQKTIGLEEPMSRDERAEKLKEVLAKYTSIEKTEFMEECKQSSARTQARAATDGPKLDSDYSSSTSSGAILKSGQKARSQAHLAGSPSRDPIFGSTALTRSSSQRSVRASLHGETMDNETVGGMEDDRGRTRTRSVTRMTNQGSLDPRDPNWAPAHPDASPMYRAPPLFRSQYSNAKANLSSLPIECLEIIARNLDGLELISLGATCIRLYDFSCLDYIWKMIVNTRFKQMHELTPQELEHVPPSDRPFKTLYFFLARLRKPAIECRVKGLNGAFMAKIVDMGALSKTGCVWMKNAALLNISTTFHAVKPGRYSLVWRFKLDDCWVPDETTFEVIRTQRTQDHYRREISLLKKTWDGKEWTVQERKNGKGKWFKTTIGAFTVDYESNVEVSIINESGNSKYGIYFDYAELWPLEGHVRLKNDLIHQQEEENERQRLDKQKYKDDKRKLNEAIQSRIESKKNIGSKNNAATNNVPKNSNNANNNHIANNNTNDKNNIAPSMASSSEDELPEALRQTKDKQNPVMMSDYASDDNSSSLNDVRVMENPAESEVEEYKKYVELRMKFADHFGGAKGKKEKLLPSGVNEEKWLEKSRKYLENLNINQDSQSTQMTEEVDREVVADTLRYPPPSVARDAPPRPHGPASSQQYASSTMDPMLSTSVHPEDSVNGFVDLDQVNASPLDPMTWSLHEAGPELNKKSRNPRVRAARSLMKGIGKLLDDETKRETTVVRVGPEDDGVSSGFGAGRDKTMTPAMGDRGRSRTVTVMKNGDTYQEIESPYAVESAMKKKRRQIAEELLDRGNRLRRHRMYDFGPGIHDYASTGGYGSAGGPKSAQGDGLESEAETMAGPDIMMQQQQQQRYNQGAQPSQYSGGPPMYYGGGGGGGQASTYGVPSQAEDPFAEIYAEEMSNRGMPMNQQQMYHPGMQMGMAMPMGPMGYGMPPMMMPGPWGFMGYPPSMGAPSMGTPSMYSGNSGMMYPNPMMMPYGAPAGNMNPMAMSMTKQKSDRVWNEAVNKYDRDAHTIRSQTVPPVLVSRDETWQDSAPAPPQVPSFSAAQPSAGHSPRMRRRIPSSRGSEYAAPSTSSGDVDAKTPHGLGPLARAEREISQVKSSKARSSQFRETRSLARASSTRTASAHAPLTREPVAPMETLPAPTTRGRSKSGVVTKEEAEERKQILKDALDRASNYEVETKVDKRKQFPLTVRHENERFGGLVSGDQALSGDRSFDQVPFPVTTNPMDLRRPVDQEKLNKLYYVAGK